MHDFVIDADAGRRRKGNFAGYALEQRRGVMTAKVFVDHRIDFGRRDAGPNDRSSRLMGTPHYQPCLAHLRQLARRTEVDALGGVGHSWNRSGGAFSISMK